MNPANAARNRMAFRPFSGFFSLVFKRKSGSPISDSSSGDFTLSFRMKFNARIMAKIKRFRKAPTRTELYTPYFGMRKISLKKDNAWEEFS